jgi:hypothetical protein
MDLITAPVLVIAMYQVPVSNWSSMSPATFISYKRTTNATPSQMEVPQLGAIYILVLLSTLMEFALCILVRRIPQTVKAGTAFGMNLEIFAGIFLMGQ